MPKRLLMFGIMLNPSTKRFMGIPPSASISTVNDCKEFFPEISIEYLCLKCQNRFKLEDARWSSSINYKVK